MSINTEEAIISFPIKFTTESQNIEDVKDEAEGLGGRLGGDAETAEKLKEFIETTDKQGLQTLSKFAKNPQGMVQNEFLSVLGKAGIHGAIATAIIAAIIATPEIVMTITRAMAQKGAPWNQDFHRFFEDEGQQGISRDFQYRRAAGFDVVITNNERGFLLQDPFSVQNSLIDIDTTRVRRLSSDEVKYGYVGNM